ncbi:tyrosine-type recombinase/integrase [Calothrix sp. NIES-2098]|uniref:tyrosine-type recombinase/integrase n=1 Tax=Calothrix sp. NIES-2098 TaxID=1954171 RepID=UPI000B60F74B|nr:integrase family protein [Calothrix sp. NIES-2098]
MRSRKGEVSIYDRQGHITLIWRYGGKRYWLALGLPTNKLNLGLAEVIKRQIESDFVTNNFDPTLVKYRPAHQNKPDGTSFIAAFLAREMNPDTKELYGVVVKKFNKYGGKEDITPPEASKFIQWLRPQVATSTLKAYVIRLSAIWRWAAEEELTTAKNPWKRHIKTIKIDPPQPKPFTQEEVNKILTGIQGNHYAPFIEFLLRVGCRLGEAIALKWGNVDSDCGGVWILATKTHQSRKVTLTYYMKQLMLAHRPPNPDPNSLVFPAPMGGSIVANNFRALVWKTLLKSVGVPYRKPHNLRVTMVSHYLNEGADPLKLSRVTGHSPAVMYRHYLGAVGEVALPDLSFGAAGGETDEKQQKILLQKSRFKNG